MQNKITRFNVTDKIESYLKDNKIKYIISDSDNFGCSYELLIGSITGNIQVELNGRDLTDECVGIQMFNTSTNDRYIYESSTWYSDDEDGDSIESEIENLVQQVKNINIGVVKIEKQIEKIKDICNEYELNVDMFIDVVYNFE